MLSERLKGVVDTVFLGAPPNPPIFQKLPHQMFSSPAATGFKHEVLSINEVIFVRDSNRLSLTKPLHSNCKIHGFVMTRFAPINPISSVTGSVFLQIFAVIFGTYVHKFLRKMTKGGGVTRVL